MTLTNNMDARIKSWYLSRFPGLLCGLTAVLLGVSSLTWAQTTASPAEYEGVGVEEHLGEAIPLNLMFTDQTGKPVSLKSSFGHGKPVIIVMAYYDCPMLCTLVLNATVAALDKIDLEPGKDFKLLTVSVDPEETPSLAAKKQTHYLNSMDRELKPETWPFLTGEKESITRLAKALGFKYKYNAEQDQYVHAAVIHILTEDGRISRYLYGIKFNPKDVKLALVEASEGKVGSLVDRVLMYCFHYDPAGKEYRLQAENIMRIGGVVTVVLMSILLGTLWRRERKRRQADLSSNHSTQGKSGPSSSS